MAENEEDSFDIDIYGDGGQDYQQDAPDDVMKADDPSDPSDPAPTVATHSDLTDPSTRGQTTIQVVNQQNGQEGNYVAHKIASTDESAPDPVHLPKQAPQAQGLKRKDGADDRYVDPGATSALFVSELHWWVNDDDIRGWANQAQCEDELEEITFSEHKVNGKSKGQAYVLFRSPQAATAAKQKIESFGEGQQYKKKFTVSYTNPYTNPFKTLPKDGPMRNSGPANNNRSSNGAYGGGGSGMPGIPSQNMGYNSPGGYRGNRGGGYNNRAGGMNSMGGYNRGGFQQPMTGGFQGGFQGPPIVNMQPYGGFQNRGGMNGGMRGGPIGMRGGRGGMGNGIMGMPMNGMGMGAMGGMGMNMPQIGGGMGMQGMPSSQNFSDAIPSVSVAMSAAFAEPPMYFAPQIRQHSHAPSASSTLPIGRGMSNSSSTWADNTLYLPPPASAVSVHFPSPVPAPRTVLPAQTPSHNAPRLSNINPASFLPAVLKRTSSWIGTQAHFNPAFFPQPQQPQQGSASPDANWNPHGVKRTRQD